MSAEIHRQIAQGYDANAMIEGKVPRWVRNFKDGRNNVHDEARSSVISDFIWSEN